MVFSSHLFLFYFLPAALLVYYAMPRPAKHLALTILSYAFYGWANPLFVVLMFTQTLIDYLAGLLISGQWRRRTWSRPAEPLPKDRARTRWQKLALALSLCSNLALLGFFKYFNFLTDSYTEIVSALGLSQLGLEQVIRVTLPVGLSFYTFHSMSYAIDVYRGDACAMRNFIDYATFVSMFPQLVAGPIIRFHEVDDQFRARTHTAEKLARGAAFVCMGLAKKVLIANSCGKVADLAFDAGSVGFLDSWLGAVAYAFQIYFDFSGYSDMAIGLGLMLGFMFAKNFDSPYRSGSFTEFWRRWHISLSTWLRDYLYIPLGGNRKGAARTYVNLAIVMLLGGLWHGAAWNFVVWGGIHCAMLAMERALGKHSFYERLPGPLRVGITFVILCFTWVFFRSADLPSAVRYCGSMLGMGCPQEGAALLGGVLYQPYYLGAIAVAAAVTWACPPTWDFTRRITVPKAVLMVAIFWLSIVVLTTQSFNPFIYFIF